MYFSSKINMNENPFLIFLVVRISSLFLVQTWFVPDEYWQATEIAHHMAFGYGYQTWEWQHGLRSALYPAAIGLIYQLLAYMKLDYAFLLIHLPRFLHAVLFSIGDYHIWKLSKKLYGQNSSYWTVLGLISSWFLEYCAPRTLTSCVEMTLSSAALYYYPWRKQRDNFSIGYLWLIGTACVIRPTAAIMFVPLCLQHLWMSQYRLQILVKYTLVILTVLSFTLALDSLYYGRFIVVPWKFAHFNVVSGLAAHYGTHPWHWYLTQGIPVTLATHCLPFSVAVLKYSKRHKELLPIVIWCIFCYSCLTHKEFRFLLPILPLCICITGDYIAFALSSQSKKNDTPVSYRSVIVMQFFMLPNFLLLVYTGMIHQRGPLDTMTVLRQEIMKHKDPNILFLMPCHSTPFYSHLHRNVPMRFLTCEPNLTFKNDYHDEADVFEADPQNWLQQEFEQHREEGVQVRNLLNQSNISLSRSLPTHLVLFDVLVRKIERFLTNHHYILSHKLFHSHVDDGRRSNYILIYSR